MSLVVDELRSDVISVGELGDDHGGRSGRAPSATVLGRSCRPRPASLAVRSRGRAIIPSCRRACGRSGWPGDNMHLAYVEDEKQASTATATLGPGDANSTEGPQSQVEEGSSRKRVGEFRTSCARSNAAHHQTGPKAGAGGTACTAPNLKGATDMEKTLTGPSSSMWRTRCGLIRHHGEPDPIHDRLARGRHAGCQKLIEKIVECQSIPDGRIVAVKVSRRNGMRFVRPKAVIVQVEVPEGSEVKVMAGSADVEVTGPVGSVESDVKRRHLHRQRGRCRDRQVGQRRRHARRGGR